jgi:hypothetical protein
VRESIHRCLLPSPDDDQCPHPLTPPLRYSKTSQSKFLSWLYEKGAWATQWATPSLEVEVNRFRMECSVQIGFNPEYITLKFVKPAKVSRVQANIYFI